MSREIIDIDILKDVCVGAPWEIDLAITNSGKLIDIQPIKEATHSRSGNNARTLTRADVLDLFHSGILVLKPGNAGTPVAYKSKIEAFLREHEFSRSDLEKS